MASQIALPGLEGAPALPAAERIVLTALERAAATGAACPSNEDLAELLDYVVSAPPGVLARLQAKGLIVVERYQRERRVTIVSTGQRTAAPATPAPHWRDRPRDLPTPPVHALRAEQPNVVQAILQAASRAGRAPGDFLADLVWLGWQHHPEALIQLDPRKGVR